MVVDGQNQKVRFKRKLDFTVGVEESSPDSEFNELESTIQKKLDSLMPGVCRYLARQEPIHSERIIQCLIRRICAYYTHKQ